MSEVDIRRAMRVIDAKGWPGGPRIIEGLRPINCIHGRRLRSDEWSKDAAQDRGNLCRLCVFEAPRLARVLRR